MSASPKMSLSLKLPHQNPVYSSPHPYTLYASPTSNLPIFLTRKILGEHYCSLSYFFLVFSTPLSPRQSLPQIFSSTSHFSNTSSLRYSLNMSNQVSNPYETTDKISFLRVLTFNFLCSPLQNKRFCNK